jgi:hypothetical protein
MKISRGFLSFILPNYFGSLQHPGFEGPEPQNSAPTHGNIPGTRGMQARAPQNHKPPCRRTFHTDSFVAAIQIQTHQDRFVCKEEM